MSIVKVKIENYKSIKYCNIDISNLNILIGRNGAGKTNIVEAIKYFHDNLAELNEDTKIFDKNNRFSNNSRITIYYDLNKLIKIARLLSKKLENEMYSLNNLEYERLKFSGYYKKIISFSQMCSEGILVVELSQTKNKGLTWNYSYSDRLFLKDLFPMYFIDTRTLDTNNWTKIWNLIGEITKMSHFNRNTIELDLENYLISEERETIFRLKEIRDILKVTQTNIKRSSNSNYAVNLAKLFFSGEIYQKSNKNLEYYSSGTNSSSYLGLILKMVNQLADSKLKEPLIIMDEPEIGLHPNSIDRLSETLLKQNRKISLIIGTHSPRLVKNLLASDVNKKIYNTRIIENYTRIYSINNFHDFSPISVNRVDDNHINSYFSEFVLLVEGVSEVELFSNSFLRILFPFLKRIDIFEALSQEPINNAINPAKVNSGIPYYLIVDMDKVLKYNKDKNSFNIVSKVYKNSYDFHNKKNKKNSEYYSLNRIVSMVNKLRIHYYEPLMSCNDPNFQSLISLIHEYFKNKNIFVFNTTIEGSLINSETLDIALQYLRTAHPENDYIKLIQIIENFQRTDKLNFIRLIYDGKSDLLFSFKSLCKIVESDIRKQMDSYKVRKGTWITSFLQMYFEEITKIKNLDTNKFEMYIDNQEQRKNILKQFHRSFPELSELFSSLYAMISYEVEW